MDESKYLPVSHGSPRKQYANPYVEIFHRQVRFPGHVKDYYTAELGDRAAVLVVRGDCILLVRQYRLLVDSIAYEIPGGGIEPNETPQEAARRECLEEGAVRCRDLEPLLGFELALEVCNSYTHVFTCRDFETAGEYTPNAKEVVERQWVPYDRCMEMLWSGRICDALTIIALLAYGRRCKDPCAAQAVVMKERSTE